MSVLSEGEASFLASIVRNTLNTPSNVWIGLHDSTQVQLHLSDISDAAMDTQTLFLFLVPSQEIHYSVLELRELRGCVGKREGFGVS